MGIFQSRGIWQRSRSVVALGLTAAVLLAHVPLPISSLAVTSLAVTSQPAKDLSQPFPCQHRACGCRSAAQCFKGCCCFTNSQKVAWAKRNRVRIPDFVVAAAAQEKKSCAHCARARQERKRSESSGRQSTRMAQTLICMQAVECQGNSTLLDGAWSIVPPARVAPVARLHEVVERWTLRSEPLVPCPQQPPVPPPRIAGHVA